MNLRLKLFISGSLSIITGFFLEFPAKLVFYFVGLGLMGIATYHLGDERK